MRKSWLQLYAPFLVLALVQALLIVVAPSRGENAGVSTDALQGVAGAPIDADGDGIADVGSDGTLTDGTVTDGGATGGATGGTDTGGTTGGTGGAATQAAGDTSHCKDGRQVGGLRTAPPCKPKFTGDNQGATYPGVTDKEIKIVYFSSEPNEQVDAILATQGLAVDEESHMDAVNQFVKFINEHYELYGRKIVVKRIVGDCPTTPPDYDKCNAAAQQVVKEKPFAVIWATSLYATVYDIWARAGIPSFGGSSFDAGFYTRNRPYRYDLGMDGSKAADHISEYYCKKMAGKSADHAGSNIHPTIGGRGTKRRLAIITPEIEANVLTGKRVQSKVDACNGGDPAPLLRTYKSNIETAAQQTQATVSALISGKATTVVCMCDPIAPVFLTKGMTANRYFPEFLLPGLGLLDYDILGRLYDPDQMAHAFGSSNLPLLSNLDDADQSRVWRATGRKGHPCGDNGCGIPWAYFNLVGTAIQMAGPQLTPLTMERGLLQDLPDLYGGPQTSYLAYGPGDYTGYEDAKEVYWDPNARSAVDGKAGAYVPLNGGKRYRLGQWPGGLSGIPGPIVATPREVWEHPRYGGLVKGLVLYTLLIEVGLQLVFGKVSLPFIPIVSLVFGVDIGIIEVGRGNAPIPPEVIANGMVLGALYSLVAMGLILVYRGNRIINFAQAQLGAVPAVIALLLIAKRGVPYLAVLPIVILGAALLGAATEVTLVRRFAQAPRLIVTVVTIGVSILLVVVEFFAKQAVGGELIDQLAFDYNSPVSSFTYRWGVQTFKGDHLMTVVIVGIAVMAMGAFFKFTDMGIAVRASAENGERASLLGIPVKRVSTIVWALAAVLSSIGIFLRGPLVGINLTGNTGLGVLLFGLAIAVMAKMESMPMAFGAGLLIGAINEGVIFSTNRAAVTDAVMFVVIIVALLVQRGALSRAMELGASSWQTVREYRSVPSELRDLREVVIARRALTFVVAAIALSAPWIFGDAKTPEATLIIIYAIVGVSLVVLTGWTGQISLGQYAISGVASGVAGMLASTHGWDFFAVMFTAGMVGAGVAVLVGLPALRIQGLFLAVATLGFAFAAEGFILKREFFGWMLPDEGGYIARPLLYGSIDLKNDSELFGITVPADAKFYWLCLLVLGLAVVLAKSLRKNRSGRILIAARDNGRLVQAFGVNLAATRLAAFAASGFIAGLAGGLIAYQNQGFEPGGFTPEKSLTIFVMAVIGGVGSIPGVILGAVYVVGLPLLPGLRDVELIDLLVSGVGLLFLLMFMPGGLIEGVYKIRDSLLRRVAAQHGVHVPSLVADSLVTEEEEGLLLDDADALEEAMETPIASHEAAPAGGAV